MTKFGWSKNYMKNNNIKILNMQLESHTHTVLVKISPTYSLLHHSLTPAPLCNPNKDDIESSVVYEILSVKRQLTNISNDYEYTMHNYIIMLFIIIVYIHKPIMASFLVYKGIS